MVRFELKIAWRHLVTGGTQTWLTIGAVALGAFLIVFLSSIIYGLQQQIISNVIGSIPNITITAPDYEPEPAWETETQDDREQVVSEIEATRERKRSIANWQEVDQAIQSLPDVVAVAPVAQGGGIVSRGAVDQSALIIGVIPQRQVNVVRLQEDIVSGDFLALDPDGAFIGVDMAEELGVGPGDRIRITASEGNSRIFIVRGLFDLGLEQANSSWIYLQLRPAQALLNLGTEVTALYVKVEELFDASDVARRIRGVTPLEVESWMEANESFLQALQSQTTTSVAIQAIAVLASAFGVSSVLIVFVVQKSRDIGIMKSMGATNRQILRIFTLEGLAIGIGGALLGTALGSFIAFLIEANPIPGRTFAGEPATLVPMQWEARFVAVAFLVAIVVGLASSFFPARRASLLNPVEVIRGG